MIVPLGKRQRPAMLGGKEAGIGDVTQEFDLGVGSDRQHLAGALDRRRAVDYQ